MKKFILLFFTILSLGMALLLLVMFTDAEWDWVRYVPIRVWSTYALLFLILFLYFGIKFMLLQNKVISLENEIIQKDNELVNTVEGYRSTISELEKENKYLKSSTPNVIKISSQDIESWKPAYGDIVRVKYAGKDKEAKIKQVLVKGTNIVYLVNKCSNKQFKKEDMVLVKLGLPFAE